MISIGDYATLEVVKIFDFGVYLNAGPLGEVLLPTRYVPEAVEIGDSVRVFIYCDSEDRVIATTITPAAIVGQCALMQCKDVSNVGAWVDWGVMKHLLVPFSQQLDPMAIGRHYIIYVLLDERSDRVIGSTKLHKYIQETDNDFAVGASVKVMIHSTTPLGYKVIVDDKAFGVLYRSEVFRSVSVGEVLQGYVKQVRESDGKLDIALQKANYSDRIDGDTEILINALKKNNGYLPIHDGSPPDLIYETLHISKKAFKKAVGGLYRAKKIELLVEGIQWIGA